MIFDKSKIYSAINADEVKIGSKGYFADKLEHLKEIVRDNDDPRTLTDVKGEDYEHRFEEESEDYWNLFYLVEEPQGEKYRPYKSNAELLEDFRDRMLGFVSENNIPAFWIKEKNSGDKYLITGFIKDDTNTYCVLIGTCFVSLEVLFESYTYLDDTPCGKQIGSAADWREEEK